MVGVIVGEFVAADQGAGYHVLEAAQQYDPAGLRPGRVNGARRAARR